MANHTLRTLPMKQHDTVFGDLSGCLNMFDTPVLHPSRGQHRFSPYHSFLLKQDLKDNFCVYNVDGLPRWGTTHLEHVQERKHEKTQFSSWWQLWYAGFKSSEGPTTNKPGQFIVIYYLTYVRRKLEPFLPRWRATHLEHFQYEQINTQIGGNVSYLFLH